MTMNNVSFTTLQLDSQLLDKLQQHRIHTPSAVQLQTIPLMISRKNVVVQSETGSGKTLAYVLPLLQNLDKDKQATQVVILAPTQELAMQIVREVEKYRLDESVQVLGLIGGTSVKRQIEKLRNHPQIVVGTPGRIHDLIALKKLKMHHVCTVIIDEVDQVLQLGSGTHVHAVLRSVRRDRQLICLSATVNEQTQAFAEQHIKDAVYVGIPRQEHTIEAVKHLYVVVQPRDKIDVLRRFIRMLQPKRAIVFVNRTDDIALVEAKLNHMGITATALYGEADKNVRSVVLSRFRHAKFQVLVATDIAARGLDINDVSVVIQYDVPFNEHHYIHRAGRTGRMGRSGVVVCLVDAKETSLMKKFARKVNLKLEEHVLYKNEVRAVSTGEPLISVHKRRKEVKSK